jgi:DNA-binding winged helix-turn-helix (wHTH) protein
LLYLIEHRDQLLRRQALLDAIWPHVVVEETNLNQAISALRRVLGETPDEHRFIVTEPGRGYRFVASVEAVPAATTEPLPLLGETGVAREPRANASESRHIESKHPKLFSAAGAYPTSTAGYRPEERRALFRAGYALALIALVSSLSLDSTAGQFSR